MANTWLLDQVLERFPSVNFSVTRRYEKQTRIQLRFLFIYLINHGVFDLNKGRSMVLEEQNGLVQPSHSVLAANVLFQQLKDPTTNNSTSKVWS